MCIKIAFLIYTHEWDKSAITGDARFSTDTSAFPTPGLVSYMLPEFQSMQQTVWDFTVAHFKSH